MSKRDLLELVAHVWRDFGTAHQYLVITCAPIN